MNKQGRLLSLDIFRGLTIVGMMIVNHPGSWNTIYSPLEHSTWNGCTPTDLVFPFFIFIVGVALSLSLKKDRFEKGRHNSRIWHIFKRSIILFVIGLFLNAFPSFELDTLRIPGVLQRIAIVFLICAILYLKANWKTQAIIGMGLLVFYWVLMTFIPFPGGHTGQLEPGINLAAYIDNQVLAGHMWSSTKTWDPEGILSTFPAITTGILGMLAGQWLSSENDSKSKVIGLFVAAGLLTFLGLAWGLIFPINKSLWTSSFVLYTGGIALNLLAFLFWLLDVKEIRHKILVPFAAFGMNAIFAYVLSAFISYAFRTTFKSNLFATINNITGDPYFSSLIYALFFTTVLFIPLWFMFRKKIIIKV